MTSLHWPGGSWKWLDYLVVPMTLIVLAWTCIWLGFASIADSSKTSGILLLVPSLLSILFGWVQVVLLALQTLSDAPRSRRRVYLLRVLDSYLACTIAFGATFSALQQIDSGQFFAATPAGIATNPWLLTVDFVLLTVLLIGGVGFGPYVAAGTGSLVVVALCNLTGWYFTLLAGAFMVSSAVQDYKNHKGGIYMRSPQKQPSP
jgi:hypothetical protein